MFLGVARRLELSPCNTAAGLPTEDAVDLMHANLYKFNQKSTSSQFSLNGMGVIKARFSATEACAKII